MDENKLIFHKNKVEWVIAMTEFAKDSVKCFPGHQEEEHTRKYEYTLLLFAYLAYTYLAFKPPHQI